MLQFRLPFYKLVQCTLYVLAIFGTCMLFLMLCFILFVVCSLANIHVQQVPNININYSALPCLFVLYKCDILLLISSSFYLLLVNNSDHVLFAYLFTVPLGISWSTYSPLTMLWQERNVATCDSNYQSTDPDCNFTVYTTQLQENMAQLGLKNGRTHIISFVYCK